MPIGAPTAFINTAKLSFAALAMVATAAPAEAQQVDDLELAYLATFANGSLGPSVNALGIDGPMLKVDSQIENWNPTFSPGPGDLVISLARPAGLSSGVVTAAGVFATLVSFGPGSVSRVSATFRAPDGPPTGGWAVVLNARTGGQNDLSGETRVNVSLRMAPGGELRLNVPFGATMTTFTILSPEIRDEIFSAVAPKPFTLSLLIDRITGTGQATLTVQDNVVSLPFFLSTFPANSEPTITAMGAGIAANGTAPGQVVSVHLREFRIYAPPSASVNSADTCGEAFAEFGCRAVPDSP